MRALATDKPSRAAKPARQPPQPSQHESPHNAVEPQSRPDRPQRKQTIDRLHAKRYTTHIAREKRLSRNGKALLQFLAPLACFVAREPNVRLEGAPRPPAS